ncbi:LOW QUALITY PROTEIN: hypothetical protein OSB04_002554 [Centaurea solstitialis]|uniref:Uncharacterized protein n=1 Tax=Centaurea solstitialis TaxID=347529 RepID=A0AA38UBH6_9ASTR|nr:LOW QUALITY PROTEIN: hypothetical protein OSB04_002554 [Centaurea solstitialis]
MEKTIAELHSMLKTAEQSMGTGTKTKDVLMEGGVKKKRGHRNTSKGKDHVQTSEKDPSRHYDSDIGVTSEDISIDPPPNLPAHHMRQLRRELRQPFGVDWR